MKDRVRKTLGTLRTMTFRLATLALLGVLFAAGAARAQVNAYVASTGNTSVLVIDTATNTTTATVAGTGARLVALSPDGAFLYSLNFEGVSKIDTATNTIVASVTAGVLLNGLAVSPNGASLYVAANGSSQAFVIDTATFTVVATFSIVAPSALALTPDGTSVWISDAFGVINVIDTANNTVSTTFPLAAAPEAIAFTPNGAFAYLADVTPNAVTVLDTTTHAVVATVPVGSFPLGVFITADGAFAYVTNILGSSVSIINTATNSVVATVPVGAFPRGVAFTPDGASAYVTNFNDNTISVIATATQTVTATFPAGSRPWGIAIAGMPQPSCTNAVASPSLLWPPNHKLVPISILGVTNPGGGAVTITVTSIFQDEPVTGGPDGTGVGTSTASVRAERDGGGDGRVYHISFKATNAGGASCTGAVTVGVPHDQGHNGGPVDEGALYDSTQP